MRLSAKALSKLFNVAWDDWNEQCESGVHMPRGIPDPEFAKVNQALIEAAGWTVAEYHAFIGQQIDESLGLKRKKGSGDDKMNFEKITLFFDYRASKIAATRFDEVKDGSVVTTTGVEVEVKANDDGSVTIWTNKGRRLEISQDTLMTITIR